MSKSKEYKSSQGTPGFHTEEASAILGHVLEACEAEPCEKSVDALVEDHYYKEKSFPVIRIIIIIVGILVLISPLFLLSPGCTITKSSSSSQNAPVYEVRITAALPVSSVTAMQNGTELPVMKYSNHTYLVEPASEGNLSVSVSLINGKSVSEEIMVSLNDTDSPVVTAAEKDASNLYLYVEDTESGVDYDKITGTTTSGTSVLPTACDSKRGLITLDYPDEDLTLSIPDKEGNILNYQIHVTSPE